MSRTSHSAIARTQHLAEERTDSAHQRTRLAEARTFSVWARTLLAAVATGFAIVKLLPEADPLWLVETLGVRFITAGGAMVALGYGTYRRALAAIPDAAAEGAPLWAIALITLALLAGAAAALALVFAN